MIALSFLFLFLKSCQTIFSLNWWWLIFLISTPLIFLLVFFLLMSQKYFTPPSGATQKLTLDFSIRGLFSLSLYYIFLNRSHFSHGNKALPLFNKSIFFIYHLPTAKSHQCIVKRLCANQRDKTSWTLHSSKKPQWPGGSPKEEEAWNSACFLRAEPTTSVWICLSE